MHIENLSIRKVVVVAGIGLLLLILIPLLINFLTTGTLVITTNGTKNQISVSSLAAHKTDEGFSKQTTGSFSAKLHQGSYFVTVQNGTDGTTQHVTIKGHTTTRITLNLAPTSGVEPVVYDNAQNIVADNSRIVYLDQDTSTVYQIDASNERTAISFDGTFRSVSWADTSFGVGQDSQGRLFVIKNGLISPLSLPTSDGDASDIVYAVTPDRKIYIGVGRSVYVGSETSSFKLLYTDRVAGSFLLAGSSKVALISSGYGGEAANIVSIDVASKHIVNHSSTVPFNGWSSWSPHEKYLLAVEGAEAKIFDASLHQVATIPQSNVAYPTWLNNHTIFYSIKGQLWSYDVTTQKSYLLANMPLADPIQEIVISRDGAYVYLVTKDSTGQGTVRRIGLHGQVVPSLIYRLQDILPENLADYSLGLINFQQTPVVLVQSSINDNGYLQKAASELQSDGFDITKLRFTFNQLESTAGE